MRSSLLKEAHVHRIWQMQSLRPDSLRTEDGRPVEVLFPGVPAAEGGPDFRAARIRLGNEELWGDVEVHLVPAGWHAHGHAEDGAFARVILHVVLDRDRYSLPGPVVVLRPCLTASSLQIARGGIPYGRRFPWPEGEAFGRLLDEAGQVRWERRRSRFLREARRIGEAEAVHRAFFTALGFRRNRGPFRELARLVPARDLGGEGEIRERLRRAAKHVHFWRRRGVRPANAPDRRIEAAVRILARGPVSECRDPVSRFTACGLGRDRARSIYLHAILPSRAERPDHPPLGSNRREREALALAPPGAAGQITSVLRQLGLLELHEGLERQIL